MKRWFKQFVVGVMAMVLVLALIGLIMPQSAQATALSAARDTPARQGSVVSLTVASNVIIYAGSLVCVNSSGYAVPAEDASGYAVVGRAESTSDNRTAVYSATRAIEVRRGVFRWENQDSIGAADIGKLVYVYDDQTVEKTGSGTYDIIAGTVVDVDSLGVWVDTAKVGPSGAATPSSLAVSGNSALTGTLSVGGVATFTAESVHNGGIDTDYVTVDAAAGVDTKTAGALVLGAATATSVTIGATDITTTILGGLNLTPNALTVTNGQVITVGYGLYVIDSVGGADDSTNTVTLAAPSAAGQVCILMMKTATTNLLTIADSGTFAGSGALLLDANDSALIVSQDTSTWCETPGDN